MHYGTLLASQFQDVMLVGEPTLMGGELGDEDERLISRLENTQYKPSDMEEPEFNVKPVANGTSGQSQQMYAPSMPAMASPMPPYAKNSQPAVGGGGIRGDLNMSSSNG